MTQRSTWTDGIETADALWQALDGQQPALAGMVDILAAMAGEWPSLAEWSRTLLLQDYNTRVVVLGTSLLGLAAGIIGSFTLLRRRALMGDAIAHATLPGVGMAFILATTLGIDGKSLPLLLCGATVSGVLGVLAILAIRTATRLKEDTALGIVLSVFFGAGIALLRIGQGLPGGHAAGLESFIYGKTASMLASDAQLIGVIGGLSVLVAWLLFKEFKLLCFDDQFAGARGFPVVLLDMVLMVLVILVTIVGLQAVGLVLMIALLVIPASAARFWCNHLSAMVLVSALLGGISCLLGAGVSAVFPRLPSGAMIVLTSSSFFAISFVVGTQRGVCIRFWRRLRLNARIDHRHVLRGMFELMENGVTSVTSDRLLALRSWSKQRMQRAVQRELRQGTVQELTAGEWSLTESGKREAARLAHEHRLWELYLITYADVAPSRVDRDADAIEHVLEPEMIAELEQLLDRHQSTQGVAPNPHGDAVPIAELTKPTGNSQVSDRAEPIVGKEAE